MNKDERHNKLTIKEEPSKMKFGKLSCKEPSKMRFGKLSYKEEGRESSSKHATISVTLFQSRTLTTFLEEVINRLLIISAIIPATVRPEWHSTDESKSLKQRFGGSPKHSTILPAVQGLQDLTDLQNLQKDLSMLIYLLKRLTNELTQSNMFSTLQKHLSVIKTHRVEEQNLKTEYFENNRKLKKLQHQLKTEQLLLMGLLEETSKIIRNLNNEVYDACLEIDIGERYSARWENSRIFQNKLHVITEENGIESITKANYDMMKSENEVHIQINKYLEMNLADLKQAIESWRVKYDEDSERLDSDIIRLKSQKGIQLTEIEELQQILIDRQNEMDEWNAEKAERKRIADLLALQNRMATIIQAYWRGYAVRHYIGQYKRLRPALLGKPKSAPKKKK